MFEELHTSNEVLNGDCVNVLRGRGRRLALDFVIGNFHIRFLIEGWSLSFESLK